ncbi:hypothetical protein [Alteraurantiacibacter aquimixticola]|uniref:DUF2219 family protein n=1 Tax=Alteraurantiacibacter aquimixticola TaxID=2489173 RepID=A0A4V4U8R9_9SPHN|nr:hypothetical protein [Alteraurantiacibacter aquimixticola]TIX51117.1 hypothetical protein E5222_01145 [Alteraurantiacibacter aquimixticola]
MGRSVLGMLTASLIVAGLGSACDAQAQETKREDARDTGYAAPGAAMAMAGTSRRQVAGRTLEADLGAGRFSLRGERVRQGEKRRCGASGCGQWFRSYNAEAAARMKLTDSFDLGMRFAVARERRGNPRAALLTGRTGGVSQALSLELHRGNRMLAVGAFDRAGWSPGNIANLAERMNNGEGLARRGIAVEYSASASSGATDTRIGLALERAESRFNSNETTALLRFRTMF